MIVTLSGNNSLGLRQRLAELTSNFIDEHSDLALERIEAQDVEGRDIIEAVQSLPFLTDRKMVVVRDLSANKAAAEQVEQIISSSGKTTDLIFYEPTTDKRTVYYKTLKKLTQLETFDELAPQELPKWLVQAAINAGGELSFADANYLMERVGPNQAILASELEKLIIYEPIISRANIDALTEPTPQSKIFELLDATFGGNKKRALKLYDEQRAQKVEPQQILAMLAWQLQLLAIVKLAKDRPAATIAKDAGLNPYPVNKAKSLDSKISLSELKHMVSEALELDRLSKTSSLDLDEALKAYMLSL
jgi:DNA polymerase-3 subunit delta